MRCSLRRTPRKWLVTGFLWLGRSRPTWRLVRESERLVQRDPALVQGAADDAPGDWEHRQPVEVIELADSTRGDDRSPNRLGQRGDGGHVRAFERTIARDVGIHDAGQG